MDILHAFLLQTVSFSDISNNVNIIMRWILGVVTIIGLLYAVYTGIQEGNWKKAIFIGLGVIVAILVLAVLIGWVQSKVSNIQFVN